MRSLVFTTLAIVALAMNGNAQESKKKPAKAEITKATYMIAGLHCEACVTAVQGSLEQAKGVRSIKVNFKLKNATIEINESVISAQEVARALSYTPHAMGPSMQYAGILVLSVAGVDDKAAGRKAVAALRKVKGVAKVIVDPQRQAVGIQFSGRGRVTSAELIAALEKAGLNGSQYSASGQ